MIPGSESFPSFGAPSPLSGGPAEEEYPLISRTLAQKSTASSDYIHRSHEKYAPNKNNWFKRTQFSNGYKEPKIKNTSFACLDKPPISAKETTAMC